MRWIKTNKPIWRGLPWPGHYEDTKGYTNGKFFIYKDYRYWTVKYITKSGALMGIGRPLPSGLKASDFRTFRDAKEAVNRLYENGLDNIPDNPDNGFKKSLTRVLTGSYRGTK